MNSPPFDTLSRKVLLAVELIDPATLAPVFHGVSLRAVGMANAPLLGWSGRFVWLVDGERWPSAFDFDPGSTPYQSETYPAPPRPADLAVIPAADRLLRIVLRPGAAYPFSDGLTAVRGRLRETPDAAAAPVEGALVLIRWRKSLLAQPFDGVAARTGGDGGFATCLRLPGMLKPDLDHGELTAHIVVERDGVIRQKVQQLPDGQLLDLPAALAWSALTPV